MGSDKIVLLCCLPNKAIFKISTHSGFSAFSCAREFGTWLGLAWGRSSFVPELRLRNYFSHQCVWSDFARGFNKAVLYFVCQEIEYNYWVWHCPAHKSINNKRGHKGKNNVVPICTSRNVNTLSSAQSDGWGETQQSFGRHTVSDLTSGAIITHKSLSARHGNGSEFTTFFFPFAGEFSFFFPTHTLYYIFQTASLSLYRYINGRRTSRVIEYKKVESISLSLYTSVLLYIRTCV